MVSSLSPNLRLLWPKLKNYRPESNSLSRCLVSKTGPETCDMKKRLADFIMLNPSQLRYEDKLKELLLDSPKPDPLLDNIELEIARITQNIDNKDIKLMNIVKEYPDTDGGVAAMVELADLLIKKVSRTDKPGEKDVYSKQGR